MKEWGCLINNVIIGGPPEASHDWDGVIVKVLTMHENKDRLECLHTLAHIYKLRHGRVPHGDNRCAIHKCAHTWWRTESLNCHCRGKSRLRRESCSDTAVLRVFLCKKCYCYWIKLISNSLSRRLYLSSPSRLDFPSPALSPPLPLFFCFLTCIAPRQPLPLSAAGVGEGEGKPGGADGALLQGAAGTSRLWQHQERRHARADVRQ